MTNHRLPDLPRNPIQRAKIDAEAQAARIKALEASINGLRNLCHSDKFRAEPYINVADVILWAQQALSGSLDAENIVYRTARQRQLIVADSRELIAVHGTSQLWKLVCRATEKLDERAVYCLRAFLDDVLDVLGSDGYTHVAQFEFAANEWRFCKTLATGILP